jgi:ParB/RepB/Spo0J family partition protein
MTSGVFASFPLDSITIHRDERQRRTLEGIKELADSIRTIGLINPPVIQRNGDLVAGERRVTALRLLGWTSAPVQFADDLSETELHLLELEENVKRVDLSWQDHNDAIARYHELKAQAEGWTIKQTADALGMDAGHISHHLTVKKTREEEPALVEEAATFSAARNIAFRRNERKKSAGVSAVLAQAKITEVAPAAQPAAEPDPWEIHNIDFQKWTPPAAPFNLIHCDFPYGVNVGDKTGQSAAKNLGGYADSPEIYFDLLDAFIARQDTFVAAQAHLIFWFSMKFYEHTRLVLEAGGWKVDAFPLIWHKSDNAGIIPDANRGPRRTYETALFAHRGDAKIIKPVANSFSGPTTKLYHPSEKSEAMLAHFFKMLVDDTTTMLDPTCGSGMAVRAAAKAGACFAVGLEIDPEFATLARENCSR